MKVRDKASQANEAVLLIRGIKAQIADRKAQGRRGKAALSPRRWTISSRRSAPSKARSIR